MSNTSSRFTEDENFANSPGDPLPPTFPSPPKREDSTHVERELEHETGTVFYTLVATIKKPFFTHSYAGPTSCQMHLPLSSLRPLESQAPVLRVISSSHRISSSGVSDDTRDTPAYHHLGPAGNSDLSINVDVSIPKYAVVTRPLEIGVRFSHDIVDLAAEILPPLVLHAVNVEVISQTLARVPNGLRRGPHAKWEQKILCCSLDVTEIPVLQRSGTTSDTRYHQWDVTSLMPTLSRFTFDVPSFKTSNLAHSYTLTLSGELRVADETIRFDVKEPVVVLPRHSRGDIPRSSSALVIAQSETSIGVDNDAPPPYQEHERPNGAPRLSDTGDEARLPTYTNTLDTKG
ncbi:MAG: hypothetical protein L6R40_005215 [Gallowayella cf. fulva]|nr:MAG: hypothetical protein L6R40_005215 [Xanthomendoza cf. fulva]